MKPHPRRGGRGYLVAAAVALLAAVVLFHSLRWAAGLLYPLHHRDLVFGSAAERRLDPLLVAAVIRVESGWRLRATSASGARGLMQIMPDTAAWAADQMGLAGFSPNHLYDAAINVRIGSWYLRYLLDQFGDDWVTALAAYNGGDHNVRRWLRELQWTGEAHRLDQIPFPETRAYVGRVLHDYRFYVRLYGP